MVHFFYISETIPYARLDNAIIEFFQDIYATKAIVKFIFDSILA